MSLARPRPYTTAATRQCPHCSKEFNVKGFTSHEKSCRTSTAAAKRDREYELQILALEEERLRKRARFQEDEPDMDAGFNEEIDIDQDDRHFNTPAQTPPSNLDDDSTPNSPHGSVGPMDGDDNSIDLRQNSPSLEEEDEEELEVDDIKVEYHPKSGRRAVIAHFRDFTRTRADLDVAPEEEPFRPFSSRGDFEFSRIAVDAGLTIEQTNDLLKLIRSVAEGASFTLTSHNDMMKVWSSASKILTPFEDVDIKVPLLKEERTYKVWRRPLWDWTLDLIRDPRLFPHITWDAERLFKYDGVNFVRFIDEPWTADRFWEIQSKLPQGSHPLCWILHADKSKLSSFGTAKGYPVIVRCANLPAEIRNGTGVGGGRVVGWLPVMKEEAAHTGKSTFKNHKRAVWHEALWEMIKSLQTYSKVGYSFVGADGVQRKIFPCIMTLSADYEEQTFMALLRGLTGLAPCPVCLVPVDKMADLSLVFRLRTTEDAKASFEKVQNKTIAVAEDELKPKGLRRVSNAFWRLENSDPYQASSFDRLHFNSLGIFGDHMWSDFKQIFTDLGRGALTKVDKQFSLMPRFRNLHHFEEVVHIYFSDGSKFEDISKQLLFASHNVLTQARSKHGYILLRCLRSFLILDTIMSFDVQTEDTIRMGEKELQIFNRLIEDYVEVVPASTDKKKYTENWGFIKMHYQVHAFDDLRNKGVTRNYNTKPNEKLHKPLRDAYHRTNFKNVEKQILNIDHRLLISTLIKSRLDELDAYNAEKAREHEDIDELDTPEPQEGSRHFYLGSAQKKQTLAEFEASHSDDAAYRSFRRRLGEHLTEVFEAHSIALPNGRRIRISAYDTITEYRFIKVNYENMVTWRQSTDYLRCSPQFFNHPRYDFVIVQTVRGPIFARLICIICHVIEGKNYPVALIHPYDAPVGRLYRKDIDLGLNRVRSKPRADSEFVSVHCIIRGAVLVPDFDKEGEFLVMDVLDGDMFLRVRNMYY